MRPSGYVLQEMLLSPQAERNWESLCCVLEDVLENQSHRQLLALELGSGTGQHVIRFAQKMPFVTWQPSDITQECLDRLVAYRTSRVNCWPASSSATTGSMTSVAVQESGSVLRVCLQHQGVHRCDPAEDGAAAGAAGCQSAVGAVGRGVPGVLWHYRCH